MIETVRLPLNVVVATAICATVPGVASAQSASSTTPAASTSSASGTQASATAAAPAPAITVTGHVDKVRSSPDSRSYDLTHDLQATTGSVADVLRNVPSVGVSAEGAVSLRGDTNVVIYVDGKPSSLFSGPNAGQLLQSMPAGLYSRVEVMTNPSAAYAPDGSAGIINLITNKARKPGGWGSIEVSDGLEGRKNLSLTASRTYAETVTLTFEAGLRHDRGGNGGADRRQTLDGLGDAPSDVTSILDSAAHSATEGDSGYVAASAEWNPNPKDQLTAEFVGWRYSGDWTSDAGVVEQAPPGDVDQRLQRDARGSYDGAGFSGDLTWRHDFAAADDDHNLIVSLTREGDTNSTRTATDQANPVPAAPDDFDDLLKGSSEPQTEFKADYTRPMPLTAVLKTGLDIRDEADRADDSGFLAAASPLGPGDPDQTDLFRFDRRIAAAYATYNQPIGKLTVLAGLRLEDTRTDLDDDSTRFNRDIHDLSLYPTLHLAWTLTPHQQLLAGYSERVQRPSAAQYDPFRFVTSPFSQSQGNPGLQDEQAHKFELGWEYRRDYAYVAATTYYSYSSGGVTGVITDLGDNVFLSTPENLSRKQNGGIELVASGRLTKTLSYNLSENTYRDEIDVGAAGFTRQVGWTTSGHGSLDWEATPKDLVQLQGSFTGQQVTAQGYRDTGPEVDLGYRHKLNDQLALQFTARDPFRQAYGHNVSEAATFTDDGWRKTHDQAASLALIWNFGRGDHKKPAFDYGSSMPAHE